MPSALTLTQLRSTALAALADFTPSNARLLEGLRRPSAKAIGQSTIQIRRLGSFGDSFGQNTVQFNRRITVCGVEYGPTDSSVGSVDFVTNNFPMQNQGWDAELECRNSFGIPAPFININWQLASFIPGRWHCINGTGRSGPNGIAKITMPHLPTPWPNTNGPWGPGTNGFGVLNAQMTRFGVEMARTGDASMPSALTVWLSKPIANTYTY